MEEPVIAIDIASPLSEDGKSLLADTELASKLDLEIESADEPPVKIMVQSLMIGLYLVVPKIDPNDKRQKKIQYPFSSLFLTMISQLSLGEKFKCTIPISKTAVLFTDINLYLNINAGKTKRFGNMEIALRRLVTTMDLDPRCISFLLIEKCHFVISQLNLYSIRDLDKYANNVRADDWVNNVEPMLVKNKDKIFRNEDSRYKIFFAVLMIAYHKWKKNEMFVISPEVLDILLQIVPLVDNTHIEPWYDLLIYGNVSGTLSSLISILMSVSAYVQFTFKYTHVKIPFTPLKPDLNQSYEKILQLMTDFESDVRKREIRFPEDPRRKEKLALTYAFVKNQNLERRYTEIRMIASMNTSQTMSPPRPNIG